LGVGKPPNRHGRLCGDDFIAGCLSRVIHFIALRLAYPFLLSSSSQSTTTQTRTGEWHSPFEAATVNHCLCQVYTIALPPDLGGLTDPGCAFSEMVTDLSDEIAYCENWNHRKLRIPCT
jgi:hypothetical protein